MKDKDPLLKHARLQIAVSQTPTDTSPDRSFWKVLPKWLKVAKLWYQRKVRVEGYDVTAVSLSAPDCRRKQTASSSLYVGSNRASGGIDVSFIAHLVRSGRVSNQHVEAKRRWMLKCKCIMCVL